MLFIHYNVSNNFISVCFQLVLGCSSKRRLVSHVDQRNWATQIDHDTQWTHSQLVAGERSVYYIIANRDKFTTEMKTEGGGRVTRYITPRYNCLKYF